MSPATVVAGPVLDHLRRLTTGQGLFEHALLDTPRPEHGYCLDDVARALVLACREPGQDDALLRHYLDFTVAAVQADGACHNRMGLDGAWSDEPALEDAWGRALWGLGVAAVHASQPEVRLLARAAFDRAASRRSPHLRSMVFAALGAGELLLADPDDAVASELLRDAVVSVGPPGRDPGWPWPEPRLRYGNGSVVEALLLAGAALPDLAVLRHGLVLLDFLLTTETGSGHLSVTPVDGWGPGEPRPGFDQQPIEVAALADACARAHAITAEQRWSDGVALCWSWFLGDNDNGTPMVDLGTGAGFDGLHRHGHNRNQGAESTIAALSTAQHAHRLGVAR